MAHQHTWLIENSDRLRYQFMVYQLDEIERIDQIEPMFLRNKLNSWISEESNNNENWRTTSVNRGMLINWMTDFTKNKFISLSKGQMSTLWDWTDPVFLALIKRLLDLRV